MFDELEETCDYVGFIKDGHLLDIVDMNTINNRPIKEYEVTLENKKDVERFRNSDFIKLNNVDENLVCKIAVARKDTNLFLNELKDYKVKLIKEIPYNLERFFMEKIIGGNNNEKVDSKN